MGLNKCCCCVSLRAGCIILAVVGIIVNCGFFGLAGQCGTNGCGNDFYVITVGNVIGIIGCVCLLFGSINYNRIGVLVYLVVEIITIILYFANAMMTFAAYAQYDNATKLIPKSAIPNTGKNTILASGISVLLVVLLSVYFWICVLSFFRKIGDNSFSSRV